MTDTKLQIICRDLDYCEEVNSTIKHILVPYDDSAYSNRAFVYALDLAKKYGATLSVISIMYSSPNASEIKHQTSVDDEKIKVMEKSYGRLRDAAKKFEVPINTKMLMETSIVDNIVSFVTANHVNLIVMGTRGRGGPRRLMFGSVAMATSQKAPCPVMLVK
jgi:nucleotide-binding universal stress UspA family protein